MHFRLFSISTLTLAVMAGLSACSTNHGSNKFDPRDPNATAPVSEAATARFVTIDKSASIDPAWLKPTTEEYTLGPGDKLEIEVLGEDGSRDWTVVTPDGKIYYSLLKGIHVHGKTLSMVKTELEKGLLEFYKHPQVSLILTDANSKRVWVLGRLYGPGIYALKRPTRVLDALSMAGGLLTAHFTGTTEELADLSHSFLKRDGKLMPVDFEKLVRDGDLSHNIYLQPNDFIYLPSALTNEVYVMGAVNSPRPVGFMNEMNVMAAIGRAFGPQADADLSNVTIVRGSLTKPTYCQVDVAAITQGKAPNVHLQPGDIIYVPKPGRLSVGSLVNEAMNTFVSTISIREGGNAMGVNTDVSLSIGGTGTVSPSVPTSTQAR